VDEGAGYCARTWASSLRGPPPGSAGVKKRSAAQAGFAPDATVAPWLKKGSHRHHMGSSTGSSRRRSFSRSPIECRTGTAKAWYRT
jgi:hypothetical protein